MRQLLIGCFLLVFCHELMAQVRINPLQYQITYDVLYTPAPNALTVFTTTALDQNNTTIYRKDDSYGQIAVVQGGVQPALLHFVQSTQYNNQDCSNTRDFCTIESGFNSEQQWNVSLRYPEMDTTFMEGNATIHVKVEPNYDISFNLPTEEQVRIVTSGTYYDGQWEYQAGSETTWNLVPIYSYSNILNVSGYDLFGEGYINHLNQTVKFRFAYRTSSTAAYQYSNISVFTHRLSAPKITGFAVRDIGCWGDNTGSVKINFSRGLRTGERLNLLLNDTIHHADYSAINLTDADLASDHSYTWRGELGAGTYFLSMIGKYSLPNDLVVSSRNTVIKSYEAQNSITFEAGFESQDGDSFEAVINKFEGGATYTGSREHFGFFTVSQPSRVFFYTEKVNDVSCKGGSNGSINIFAKGGTGRYTYFVEGIKDSLTSVFSTMDIDPPSGHVKQAVGNLKAGTYKVRIRDANNCFLKDTLGNEFFRTVVVGEPAEALHAVSLEVTPMTAYNLQNGIIKVDLAGGSPFWYSEIYQDQYSYEWRDSATNQVVGGATADTAGGRFQIRIGNLKEGTYILRVHDNNVNSFDLSGGCNLVLHVPILKPLPLQVNVGAYAPISCAGANNGKLVAVASGGHKIDSIQYRYEWYQETGSTPVRVSTTEAYSKDSILVNVVPGRYFVIVKDKYNTPIESAKFTVTEPSPLQVSLSSWPASCYSTANGQVSASATGGTAGYNYAWSTGDRTPAVDSLPGGTYVVIVTDANGCEAKGQVAVTSPVQVTAVPVVTPVSCLEKTDGRVQLNVSGGGGVYSYAWSHGATTATASNLAPGTYWYRVTDQNGCFDTDTLTLDTPAPFTMNLEPDRNICVGQRVVLAPTVAPAGSYTYVWTGSNGFSANGMSATVMQPGSYVAEVTNARNCVLRDTITLSPINSTVITDFIVSSQAFRDDNVVLINMSNPVPDSVKWEAPVSNTVDVIQMSRTYCELKFRDTGRYEVVMKAYYASGCIDLIRKQVIVVNKGAFVNAGSQVEAYLQKFTVAPNPSNGQFGVDLLFNSPTKCRLRLINTLSNVLVDDRTLEGQSSYSPVYNYSMIIPGTYVLILETPKGTFIHKVIVQ